MEVEIGNKQFKSLNEPDLKKNFFLLNAIGWFTIILIDTFIVTPKINLQNIEAFITVVYTWTAGCFISILMHFIYNKLNLFPTRIYLAVFMAFIISGTGAFLWDGLIVLGDYMLPYKEGNYTNNYVLTHYFVRIATLFPILTTWSFLYLGIKFFYAYMFQKMKADEAEKENQFAQFQMLRYQLNPHFLFNSLNSIRALIKEDPPAAEKMITQLSNFFRYSLTKNNSGFVTLEEELAIVKNYLEIEKKRFESKLEVTYEIEPGSEKYPVLNFLLHPIVENAIKYGMQTTSLPLRIIIKSFVIESALHLSIKNSGMWITNEESRDEGTGTGLSNIKKRLEHSYPGRHSFEINKPEGFVEIVLSINNTTGKGG